MNFLTLCGEKGTPEIIISHYCQCKWNALLCPVRSSSVTVPDCLDGRGAGLRGPRAVRALFTGSDSGPPEAMSSSFLFMSAWILKQN